MEIGKMQFMVLSPTIVLAAGAFIILLGSVFLPKVKKTLFAYTGALSAAVSLALVLFALGGDSAESHFSSTLMLDNLSLFSAVVFLIGTILTLILSAGYVEKLEDSGEYYALLLLATLGMIAMTWTENLLMIFVGLEIMAISCYILTGYFKSVRTSTEAAMKYFLTGAFSSGILLYGIAVVFGLTGTLNLSIIGQKISDGMVPVSPFLLIGAVALLTGFLFKIAAFPFHFWSPDAYEGAPTPVAGYMSVASKAAAFVVIIRLMGSFYIDLSEYWIAALYAISVLTMIVGNVVAIAQTSIKRMLAFSSIAHAGYMLIGVIAMTADETSAATVLFYLLSYTFMNIGAFAVVMAAERKTGGEILIFHLKGMGFKFPFLGFAMAVFMFSLAGVPPTAGFFSKFYVFTAAISAGYTKLVIIAVINSLISAFFYLRVLVFMYMSESDKASEEPSIAPSLNVNLVLSLSVILIILIGVFPPKVLDWVQGVF